MAKKNERLEHTYTRKKPSIDAIDKAKQIAKYIYENQKHIISSEFPDIGLKTERLFGERELLEIFPISKFMLSKIREKALGDVKFKKNKLDQWCVDASNLEKIREYLHEQDPDKGYIHRFDKPFCFLSGGLKGGAGKTLTSTGMAQYLSAYYGLRTLIIDLDPQASASALLNKLPDQYNNRYGTMLPFMMNWDQETLLRKVSDEYEDEYQGGTPLIGQIDGEYVEAFDFADMNDPFSIIRGKQDGSRYWPNLDYVYANLGLYDLEIEMSLQFQEGINPGDMPYERLRNFIQKLSGKYDVVVLDVPPAFSHSFMSAIHAADGIAVTTPAKSLDFISSAETLTVVSDLLQVIKDNIDPDRELSFLEPIIPNYDTTSETETNIADMVYDIYECDHFRIRKSELVTRASEFGRTIFDVDPKEDTNPKLNPIINSTTYQNGIYPFKKCFDHFAKKILEAHGAQSYERNFAVPQKYQEVKF